MSRHTTPEARSEGWERGKRKSKSIGEVMSSGMRGEGEKNPCQVAAFLD